MTALLFQPKATVKGVNGTGNIVVTQDEEDWFEVSDYAELVSWIDVYSTTPSGGTISLYLETSPTKDEALFVPTYPAIQISSSTLYSFTTGPLVVKTVRTPSTVPLARWLRWRLVQTGATAAWDATFRIRCKLLRQDSFVPTDLAGCQLWLRGDLGITLGSGGNVSGWADQSGVGNNASQATTTKQPTYSATAMNGFPAIHGDGANFWMSTTNNIGITTNATLFAAVQPASSSQGVNHIRIMEMSNSSSYYLGCDQAGTEYQLIVNYNTSPFGTAITPANSIAAVNQLVTGWYQGGSPGTGTIYLNGKFPGNSDTTHFDSPTTTFPLDIMSAKGGSSLLWTGYVGEIIIYNRALSTQELIRVHRYLGARYGVSVP